MTRIPAPAPPSRDPRVNLFLPVHPPARWRLRIGRLLRWLLDAVEEQEICDFRDAKRLLRERQIRAGPDG